ncbi:YpiB family protein [Gottfriedia acidiceleris]|uniref:YpiB family protein n=1 Tax=Gottfriedia acidiceleris TaxID=371036 RepID=A0ABY4JQ20_9BACI|nr:YpiB family protein [Gottfriedia acidiceleris]UPM55939.1 YpiB family protein [Gottfriedia acidiceleris]
MEQMTVTEKKIFLNKFLEKKQVKKDIELILHFLLAVDEVLTNISFVDDAKSTPNGIVINFRKDNYSQPQVSYYENSLKIDLTSESIYHKLRLHGKETPFYLELLFDVMPIEYALILDTNPFSTTTIESNDEVQAEIDAFLSSLVVQTSQKLLLCQIDKALDERNEQLFLFLTSQLKY